MPSDSSGAAGLAARYATALYDLAEADNALDQVADDLRQLSEMISGSDDMSRLIRSPVIPRSEQGQAITKILEQMGAHALTIKFSGVISANRRLFALPDMISEYLQILAGRRGEVTADVTSAKPLSERQSSDLVAALQQALGGKISLNAVVDPKVLGGLVVRVGSRMIDSSLQTKLQQLRLTMRGVG